eukprot:CAMPEP_0196725782 /NCGR_PEP_ID=MMETSP1091-20130531/7224_1 /TAXON_ID=302021 /ORGANISM="Rhodomonas sp., Strain CCMP768" /LENGTH=52 /DNA_ID=CAMNT_0042068097 /DNA_START=57 /DNA_END=215 /DNA_ORIENTATION=+
MLWGDKDSLGLDAGKQAALDACKYQSSCNLTKQADAKKARKSLNIIHIGNIY